MAEIARPLRFLNVAFGIWLDRRAVLLTARLPLATIGDLALGSR